MRNRLPVLISSIVIFYAIASIAQESSSESVSTGVEFLFETDLGRLDSIKNPNSILILHLVDDAGDARTIDDNLLEKLERFGGVRTLILACPQLTNQSFKHIAMLKNLECLIVYGCKMTETGIEELKPLKKLQIVGLHDIAVSGEAIAKFKTMMEKTYVESGSFGKNGKVFDANGCLRPQFLKPHLTIPKDDSK